VKTRKIFNIKKFSLLGLFFFFTNFLSINFFKKVDLQNTYLNVPEFISINDLTENSSLQLPSRLIFIKTKLIEKELEQNLSLRHISINRQIFPFGLNIKIQARKPIAYANREFNGNKVEGFVDKDGVFIDNKYSTKREKLIFPVKIIGWNKDFKKIIALIIKKYEGNDDLEIIKISPEGFITLEEKFLQKIYLGSQIQELEEKLNLIFDIKEQIKKQKIHKKIKSLDLSDLNNPKIKVFIP
tara:strand:+ start:150 stop:872 length:723 start_codon:yes stop_codon:yes gene_type:complete